MGYGIWTVEIIPAEIQPPARSVAGASGNRVRIGAGPVNNGGDDADVVVAFNEQVLLGRVRAKELKPDAIILLESMWREHADPKVAAAYVAAYEELVAAGYRVHEIPFEKECRALMSDARKGKNMFVLGLLCSLFSLDLRAGARTGPHHLPQEGRRGGPHQSGAARSRRAPGRKPTSTTSTSIPLTKQTAPQVVCNGNTALALGVLASGMEVCAMYPITPATSASHYLSEVFEKVGGIVHQAEDEIAACAFAIGASYAGKCAVTITSGPGYSLKQEGIGLAVMTEIPLVVVNVQRGGPSTGQPTKAEQSDLFATMFGSHGDAPKVVMAASTIEDCFYSVITARKIAETFNMVVVVLSDSNLATSQQPFPRPTFDEAWLAPPIDQSPIPEGAKPYDWDPVTGVAQRFIPGQPGGMHTVTGLAHDSFGRVAYDAKSNEDGLRHRSLKLAAVQKTLKTPAVYGADEGDLLIVGWGSTRGAIEEAVDRLRADGLKVSSLNLRFIQPLPPGLKEIMRRFKQVITIENNWSDRLEDPIIDEENRRYSQLAMLLRSRTLIDIDCWTEAKGQPLKPSTICAVVRERLSKTR